MLHNYRTLLRFQLCTVAVSIALQCNAASAQQPEQRGASEYPAKPVRIIVPLAPGGGSDIVGRIVAGGLAEQWNRPVVIDNRPGAGSTVGTAMAANATADGYTLLVSSSSIAISPALYKKLDFDIERDFSGITLIASQPSVLAVQASVPVHTLAELVSYAKAHPDALAYGSAGSGSATHLGTELLKYSAGIKLMHLPYKSAGQATTALLSGEAQVLLTNMASVLPHRDSGRIRLLGISSARRSALAPEMPTLAESGLPGFEYTTWYGMLAPAATSKHIVQVLYADTSRILKRPDMQSRFKAQGLDVYGTSPDEFSKYLGAEIKKWDKVVRAAGISAE